MAITETQTAALRAHLAGKAEVFDRLGSDLAAQPDGWGGYGILLAAAFYIATNQVFTAGQTSLPEVINYVAEVRSQFEQTGTDINPVAAERLIRFALGDGDTADMDDRTVLTTQSVLLPALAERANVNADLDTFIDQAQKIATKWGA